MVLWFVTDADAATKASQRLGEIDELLLEKNGALGCIRRNDQRLILIKSFNKKLRKYAEFLLSLPTLKPTTLINHLIDITTTYFSALCINQI